MGDIIFNAGEIPSSPRLVIISKGELTYMFGKRDYLLSGGMHCCEPCIWVQWVHRGMLSSLRDALLYSLDVAEFQQIVISFEHSGYDPMAYAQEFVDKLNSTDPDDVSD